jgi:hypothetical protein
MVSFNHPGFRNSSGDSGGPFLLNKVTYDVSPMQRVGQPYNFEGSFYPGASQSGGMFPTLSQHTNSELDSLGTSAIARVEPTNPAFDMASALGETITGGVPSALGHSVMYNRASDWKNKAELARSAGKEHLNVQFGWLPLVSDIIGFATSVVRSHDIIDNYRAGSGSKIRRRFSYRADTSSQSKVGSLLPSPTAVNKIGSGCVFTTESRNTWFSGAFRYYVPVGSDTSDKLQRFHSDARKLIGVDLTPEVLWNLAPWSWAVDWYSTTGDVLHNVSALGTDGLVMQYGYMMSTLEYEETRNGRWTSPFNAGSYRRTEKHLLRRPATPYGFGFDMSGITARQASILVALGLSKV